MFPWVCRWESCNWSLAPATTAFLNWPSLTVTKLLSVHIWRCRLRDTSWLADGCPCLQLHSSEEEEKVAEPGKRRKAENLHKTMQTTSDQVRALPLASFLGWHSFLQRQHPWLIFFFLKHPNFKHWFMYTKHWRITADTFTCRIYLKAWHSSLQLQPLPSKNSDLITLNAVRSSICLQASSCLRPHLHSVILSSFKNNEFSRICQTMIPVGVTMSCLGFTYR